MTRFARDITGTLILALAFLTLTYDPVHASEAVKSGPNVLWISCEDLSPHLGCYGDALAQTPVLDALAADGVRFTNAFSCHGVCAPSRTGIITGRYPISLGANHMRSKVGLPPQVRLFPELLRNAGYYCSNNSKTDYNLVWKESTVWDESGSKAHWRNRTAADQPFFAVFNLNVTHESGIWKENWSKAVEKEPQSALTQASDVQVPPLYPDTPEIRSAIARLYDTVRLMDRQVGEILQQLKEDGLYESTVIFFWSDHGDGLPRCKRWTYDSGTRVPLIVRVPPQFRREGSGIPGAIDSRLVSLLDLGPSVLDLAAVQIPEDLHGRSLFPPTARGSSSAEDPVRGRKYIHGARDRIDERPDLVRSVRTERYRYVRHYFPWRPMFQHLSYAERGAISKELRRLLSENQLPETMARWYRTPTVAEELFDLTQDPWELQNIAADQQFQDVLHELRDECDRWQLEVGDVHLIPEAVLAEEEAVVGSRWQISHQPGGGERLSRLLKVAGIAAGISPYDSELLRAELNSADAAARWWALSGLIHHEGAKAVESILKRQLEDPSPVVWIVAAEALRRMAAEDAVAAADRVLQSELLSSSPFVRHAAILAIDDLGAEAIRSARSVIEMMPPEEYSSRVARHALDQLRE
ncbi:MAG: sulfatase-like hydrolase/transferase [Planctomyces sp.]